MIITMDLSSGLPPMPTTTLTMEQQFKLRRMADLLEKAPKEEIIPLFLDVQKTNFILTNNIGELLKAWTLHPITPEDQSKSGISSETKG